MKSAILRINRCGRSTIPTMVSAADDRTQCSGFRLERQSLVASQAKCQNHMRVLATRWLWLGTGALPEQCQNRCEIEMLFDVIRPAVHRIPPFVVHALRLQKINRR